MITTSAIEFMLAHSSVFSYSNIVLDFGDQGMFNKEYVDRRLNIALSGNRFDQVTHLYKLFGCERIVCDLKKGFINLDLNYSIKGYKDLYSIADITTNHGTSEHVFNQVTFFEAMHLMTKENGHMLHVLNCQGWADGGGYGHGFYLYQPKFVKLLAEANEYELIDIQYNPSSVSADLKKFTPQDYPKDVLPSSWPVKYPHFSSLLVLLKKVNSADFVIPTEY